MHGANMKIKVCNLLGYSALIKNETKKVDRHVAMRLHE
jgi:hypothetical protein